MHRRTALTYLAATAAIGAPVAVAQVANITDAINKAGAQRMLSQRLSKAYLMLGIGVATDKAQAVLNESMARFDRQLVELAAFAPKPAIKKTYAELQEAWTQYKTLLVGHLPTRDNAPALIALDDMVLRLAQQGTLQLEQESGSSLGRIVNVCGRQRMLSQRAAKFFLAHAWKAPVPQAETEMSKALEEFTAAMGTLEQAPQATPAIKQELDLARNQWVFFDVALSYRNNVPKASENVFLSSENVLGVMERVTTMYARLTA